MAVRRLSWAAGAGVVLLAGALRAAVPDVISYQGMLLAPDGRPVTWETTVDFKIIRGGDAKSLVTDGELAYHEKAEVTPVDGVVSHLIGTGHAQSDCALGRCVLNADAFDVPSSLPVWIELSIDPDGTPDTGDETVMLPRTRVGTVGFAYRVATIEGAVGGNLTGTLTTDQIVSRRGTVVGEGLDADVTVVSVDRGAGDDPAIVWDDADERFRVAGANIGFDDPATTASRGLEWTVSKPVPTKMFSGVCSTDFGPSRDNIMAWSYNRTCNGARINPAEHAFQMQLETSYDYSPDPGRQDKVEVNWDYTTPGGTQWRPFGFGIDVRSGEADWTFQPNNSNGGRNFSMQLAFPNVAINRDAGFDAWGDAGLSSFARSANFRADRGTTATRSSLVVNHTDSRPYNFTGVDSSVDYASAEAAAWVYDVRAGWFRSTFSGTADGRFANTLDGMRVDVNATAVASGPRDIVNSSAAYRAHYDFSGTNITLAETTGFLLDTPTEPGPAMLLRSHTGLRIDDQRYDRTAVRGGHAIYVAPQSVSDAAEGNVVVAGTGYNQGHYQIGTTHLWEESPGTVAVKSGAPTSDSDGARLVTSARSPLSGPAAWAADGVSCTAACASIGQPNCSDALTLRPRIIAVGSCSATLGTRVCQCY